MELTIEQALQQAVAAHKEGKLEDAERLYRAVLQSQPAHPDTNHNLGVLEVSVNKTEAALPLFKTALEANPRIEQFWLSYIDALIKEQQFEAAKQVIQQGKQQGVDGERLSSLESQLSSRTQIENINISSPSQQQLNSLLKYYQTGQYGDAESLALSITEEFPKHQFFWKVLGVVLKQTGRISESLVASQKSVQLMPQDAEAHNNLGVTLKELGRLDEADASYRQAIAFKPDYAEAHNNLGNTLKELGKLDEAEASCTQAIALKPDYAKAHSNLGNTLQEMGRLDEAETSYRQAIALKPDSAEAHNNLGVTLKELGRLDEAKVSYKQAIAITPDYAKAHSNRLFLIASMHFQSALYQKYSRDFSNMVSKSVNRKFVEWTSAKKIERLRIGFVSGDFKLHPVGCFLEGLLIQLQSSSCDLFAYPTVNFEDQITGRLKHLFHAWQPLVGLSDEQAAQRIHNDKIHILIDLSGHTAHNRLPVFAWKPAPVQVTWLGYFASTGLSEMDYLLGDPFVTPKAEADHFIEEIWRLPESYLCFTPPKIDVAVGPLPAFSNGFITFGCFNRLSRMTDEVVATRAKILCAVPASKLFLKDKQLENKSMCDRVIARFRAYGISTDRLILEGRETHEKYLACYNRVDVALSPFPYGGGTTSVEGLWMGVPVITKRGNYFLSHLGESIAHNSGLSDWVATDKSDYIAKAINFSSDLEALDTLRKGLREWLLQTPLFDVKTFAYHFEQAVWEMRRSIDQN